MSLELRLISVDWGLFHSWEECQQLMMAHNFLESLQFFDRDHIPKPKVRRLQRVVDETNRFDSIGSASKAAVPLGMWLNALLDYHKVTIAVEPLKERLKVAEETLINVSSACFGAT